MLGPASSAVRTAAGSLSGSVKAISAALVLRRYPLTGRLVKSGRDRWAHPSRAEAGSGPSCRRGGPGGVPAAELVGQRFAVTGNDHLFPVLDSADKLWETVFGLDDGDVHGSLIIARNSGHYQDCPSIRSLASCARGWPPYRAGAVPLRAWKLRGICTRSGFDRWRMLS
jgi:hypothetical protein